MGSSAEYLDRFGHGFEVLEMELAISIPQVLDFTKLSDRGVQHASQAYTEMLKTVPGRHKHEPHSAPSVLSSLERVGEARSPFFPPSLPQSG
jgi:hypothetical protein